MSQRRVIKVAIGIGILVVAGIVIVALLQGGASKVQREARLEAAVLELSTWRSGQPGMEDVTIRRAQMDLPFIVIEGVVDDEADIERLMDRIEAFDDVELRVQVTVRTAERRLEDHIGSLRDRAEPVTIGGINAHAIGDIIIAPQPGANDFEALRDMGVTIVMNNRLEGESALDEQAIVERLGMTYVHLPFRGAEQLTDELIEQALVVFGETEGGVFGHCASGNRTSALWLAHRVVNEGADFDVALAEARWIGLRSRGYIDVVRDYVDRQ